MNETGRRMKPYETTATGHRAIFKHMARKYRRYFRTVDKVAYAYVRRLGSKRARQAFKKLDRWHDA